MQGSDACLSRGAGESPLYMTLSAEVCHYLTQSGGTGAELVHGKFGERDFRGVVHFVHVRDGFVGVDYTGEDFVGMGADVAKCALPVGGVVMVGQTGKAHDAAVVHGDTGRAALCDFGDDFACMRDE